MLAQPYKQINMVSVAERGKFIFGKIALDFPFGMCVTLFPYQSGDDQRHDFQYELSRERSDWCKLLQLRLWNYPFAAVVLNSRGRNCNPSSYGQRLDSKQHRLILVTGCPMKDLAIAANGGLARSNTQCRIELGWNHETERTRPLRERCVFLRSLRAFIIHLRL